MSWLAFIATTFAATPLDIPKLDDGEGAGEEQAPLPGARKRAALMEVNLRARYLMVPDVVLDI